MGLFLWTSISIISGGQSGSSPSKVSHSTPLPLSCLVRVFFQLVFCFFTCHPDWTGCHLAQRTSLNLKSSRQWGTNSAATAPSESKCLGANLSKCLCKQTHMIFSIMRRLKCTATSRLERQILNLDWNEVLNWRDVFFGFFLNYYYFGYIEFKTKRTFTSKHSLDANTADFTATLPHIDEAVMTSLLPPPEEIYEVMIGAPWSWRLFLCRLRRHERQKESRNDCRTSLCRCDFLFHCSRITFQFWELCGTTNRSFIAVSCHGIIRRPCDLAHWLVGNNHPLYFGFNLSDHWSVSFLRLHH